jgi:hypothetical protein
VAGERKGKTYEALVKGVLDEVISELRPGRQIFWNDTPDGMTIEPDFTVGLDKNHPEIVILVTHSGSAAESHKKLWRNLGELVECKTGLPVIPNVYNIAFDAVLKQDVKHLQATAFDGQLIVGDYAYGAELVRWVSSHAVGLPVDKDEKSAEIHRLLRGKLAEPLEWFTSQLRMLLQNRRPELDQLWALHRQRNAPEAPRARDTAVRRAFTKALLLGVMPESRGIPTGDVRPWMVDLGLVKRTIAGYRFTDSDLIWLQQSALRTVNLARLYKEASSRGFLQQLDTVRDLGLLEVYLTYINLHYEDLITQTGMLKHLRLLRENPATGIDTGSGVAAPKNVWLFDAIAALKKASGNLAQDFGYSQFGKHQNAANQKIGNMQIGAWCACFMNQYFSRKPGFISPPEAEEFVAMVLAETLASLPRDQISALGNEAREYYIGKVYRATLLSHNGFDPIEVLISESLLHTDLVRIGSCFGELAGTKGQAGRTELIKTSGTLINWQSVTESGRDHKKKELCGRAVALRYSWDPAAKRFSRRPGVKKLILVVDGTWRQNDLEALVRAGWDEIFYPDQLDNLTQTIV